MVVVTKVRCATFPKGSLLHGASLYLTFLVRQVSKNPVLQSCVPVIGFGLSVNNLQIVQYSPDSTDNDTSALCGLFLNCYPPFNLSHHFHILV